ncbi:MAG: DNA mismatch repair endonuclease MutL, partial [Phascolarctobacterium sp.]
MADTHMVQLLDTNTANQIAAGEVVEKPASVVKELVENALDAGASQIDVTTFGGGTEYIRVVDNGCGMSEANARLAVLRHATSKIVKAEDLMSLHTLGFRGEALPSIASVSNFTLLTRPADEDLATSVHIDGGENMEVTSTGGSAGTTVIVENLFFNVPARRKFLKTVVTEGRYISELLTKLALSRPDVRFRLVNNDKEVLHTPGDGDLQGTIRALYGRNVAQELLTVNFADPKIKITGFIGKPTLLKGNRQWQTLFVNGRSIGNKMLAKAIDHAYQSQIPKSGFPFAVLNITIDTAAVDVNVHPQKSEIKFSDESLVYKAMFKALTDALTRPMSAQKTEMTLLPDSELNVYV